MSEGSDHVFAGTERFSVLRLLGAGGMGAVHHVFDHERGQSVALKVMRGDDPITLYRFKQEFRSLANLSHPNLLPLHELFETNGTWCFTMELLENPLDFRRWVSKRSDAKGSLQITVDPTSQPTSTGLADGSQGQDVSDDGEGRDVGPAPRVAMAADEARLRAALIQLVEGVNALHAAGMLHRDLKPDNVLVMSDGHVRLLDFGLVVELKPGTTVPLRRVHESNEAHLTGTVHYMSPEQAASAPLTPASDWYAVGVMLYEALTGRKPFDGSLRAVLRAKEHTLPARPSEIADGVPEDLDRLCMALLRRRPEERPTGAEILTQVSGGPAPAALDEGIWEIDPPFVGRQEQLATLARAFERARAGRVVVCRVRGLSGAGKSALVEQFQAQLAGRTEVVTLSGRCYEQESVPYKAWDSLVDSLYRHLSHLPAAELMARLPDELDALAQVFPVLRRLLPADHAVDARGGRTSLREQRSSAFRALGQLLARLAAARPLVLSIDDLQWGDVDSAHLLTELLRTPHLTRLLVVLAYRTEYEHRSGCLAALEAAWRDAGPTVDWDTIDLAAMSEGETLQLALALLGPGRPGIREMADRILHESGGNAFFIHELVRHVRTGMDLGTTNAVDLDAVLAVRVQRLDDGPRRLLEMVAVAGQPIRVRDAAEACGFESLPPQFVTLLRSRHFARTSGPGLDDEIECFHDRVRESVASRLETSARLACHARLALVLEASGRAEPQTIAAHLQHSAPARASQYFERAGEGAVSALAFDRVEEYFQEAVRLAGSPIDKARIQETLIHFYTDMARFADAYAMGRTASAAFGVQLPERFSLPPFLADCVGARLRVGWRSVNSLVDVPEMADERRRWAVRLIAATAKAAFQLRPELCVAISAKAVRLCLRHGNTAESAVPYMVFGSIFLGGVLGRYETGYAFGQLSLALSERFANRKQRAEVLFVVGYFGSSWLRPATEAEALWRAARAAGLKTGDLFHTGCACAGIAQSLLMRGVRLEEVAKETDAHLDWLERVHQREPAGCLKAIRQTVRSLRGETESPASFNGETFREEEFAAELEHYGSRHFAHYYFIDKMLALYLWKEYSRARVLAERAAAYLKDSTGMLHSSEHVFYDALIAAAVVTSGDRRPVLRRAVSRACRRFARWAARCPANFVHKHRLLAAESARLSGAMVDARVHYDAAIDAARTYGYLQVEGIAHERAADMLDRQHDGEAAARYRDGARRAWMEWGATGLAAAVDTDRPRTTPIRC